MYRKTSAALTFPTSSISHRTDEEPSHKVFQGYAPGYGLGVSQHGFVPQQRQDSADARNNGHGK